MVLNLPFQLVRKLHEVIRDKPKQGWDEQTFSTKNQIFKNGQIMEGLIENASFLSTPIIIFTQFWSILKYYDLKMDKKVKIRGVWGNFFP